MEEEMSYDDRRGRSRGRPRGRLRGRQRTQGSRGNRRNKIESDDEGEEESEIIDNSQSANQIEEDCDITALEAPTFTTLDRGPPAPMLQLSWNHPVNLIGEKVLSPRIHTCDLCKKLILIYGRMIPCKHVFCLWCAKGESERICARCGERVARVEQAGLGTVYMCNFSNNDSQCKRTYLSQRDLQAHIDHRHMKISGSSMKDEAKDDRLSHRDPRGETRNEMRQNLRPDPRQGSIPSNDPRVSNKENIEGRENFSPQFSRSFNPNQPPPSKPPTNADHGHHIPVMTSSRTNLITVPIQDGNEAGFQVGHTSGAGVHRPPMVPPPPTGAPQVPHPSSQTPHNPLSHPPPHPFTSPPPIAHSQTLPYSSSVTSTYTSYSASQHPTQYVYAPSTGAPNQPPVSAVYSSSLPPVPVPPPTTFGSRPPPPHYEGQYTTPQWSTPPPRPGTHPVPHPVPLPSQPSSYYR